MVDLEIRAIVHLADGERRTGNFILAAGTACHTAHKSSLATAQVTNQLDNLTPFQRLA